MPSARLLTRAEVYILTHQTQESEGAQSQLHRLRGLQAELAQLCS